MASKTRIVLVYLVIALALTLSGCGFAQPNANQACAAYKNGDYETAKSAFASLAREKPAYQKQLEEIGSILNYQAALERARELNKNTEGNTPRITIGEPDSYVYGATSATKSLDLFCS